MGHIFRPLLVGSGTIVCQLKGNSEHVLWTIKCSNQKGSVSQYLTQSDTLQITVALLNVVYGL